MTSTKPQYVHILIVWDENGLFDSRVFLTSDETHTQAKLLPHNRWWITVAKLQHLEN